MYRRINLVILAALLMTALSSWGFFAHKRINHLAVFTLPAELAGFYKAHINYLTEHAVDADKRCYVDTSESPRHYLDADRYGEQPFDSIPLRWNEAVEKFTAQKLLANGIVPWQIERSYYNLVNAFKKGDTRLILRHSADIGHYLADAHVPLHTTSNYNGQLTNQAGIHAFWESRLPELFAADYNFYVGRAHYIADPLRQAWEIVKQSYQLVDSVLEVESRLNHTFSADRKYAFTERNQLLIRTYSDSYAQAYHEALHGIVERRMREAIAMTGSYWYTAWADAGQPDLKRLLQGNHKTTDTTEPDIPAGQKIIGREEWR